MKRILYTLALLALVACSDDEVINQSSSASNEMRFSATTDNSALVTSRRDHVNDQGSSKRLRNFKLFAEKSNTDDVYLAGEELQIKENNHSFMFVDGFTRYWPSDGNKLDFYAVHANDKIAGNYIYGVIADLPEFGITNGEKGVTIKNFSSYTDKQKADKKFPNFYFWCMYYLVFYNEDLYAQYLSERNYNATEFTSELYLKDDVQVDIANFLKEKLGDDYVETVRDCYETYGIKTYLPVVGQDDMLYNAQKNVAKPDGGELNLQFHHALSSIEFKMSVNSRRLLIEIPYNGIQLVGFKNKATFSFGHVSDDVATGGNVVSSGDGSGNYDNCKWVMNDDADDDECSFAYTLLENDSTNHTSTTAYSILNAYTDITFKSGTHFTNTAYTLDGRPLLLIPQHVDGGSFNGKNPSGLFLKLSCYIGYIADTDGFEKYLSEYMAINKEVSTGGYCTGTSITNVSWSLFRAFMKGVTWSVMDSNTGETKTFGPYGPYGMMLFGNTRTFTSSTTYKNTATYKDLYIPLPEITWKPGKSYVYNITFDTESGSSTQVYDEEGNPVLMNISVAVKSIDQWGNGGTSEVEITQ
jgi:hypothetical protein